MDTQLDEQIDRYLDEQIDRYIDEQIDIYIDKQIDRYIDSQIHRYIDELIDICLNNRCMVEYIEEQIDIENRFIGKQIIYV